MTIWVRALRESIRLMDQRSFSGKILLFGEYSILAGSDAAIMPYRKVHARMGFFRKDCRQPDLLLQAFLDHLIRDEVCKMLIDTSRFERDLNEGISFESTIPMNKGLGSSGAICALVYHNYHNNQSVNDHELKNLFSRMESWFHGKSSGIDPLCIYLNKPLISRAGYYSVIRDEHMIATNSYKPFLIDSGKESETRPLVNYFREQLETPEFAIDFTRNYIPLVNASVDQWGRGELSGINLKSLSEAQLHYFNRMIPGDYSEIWKKGLTGSLYSLKLCGSGGGGMILGFTSDIRQTQGFMRQTYKLDIIPVLSGEETVVPD